MRILISGPRRWNQIQGQEYKKASLAKEWIAAQLDTLSSFGNIQVEVGSSLQLGLDTYAASLAVSKGIPITVILSCTNQDEFWSERQKLIFRRLSSAAKETLIVEKKPYSKGCIGKQSEKLISWLLEDPDPVLLLIRNGELTKTQRERIARLQNAGGRIKFLDLRRGNGKKKRKS